MIWLLMNTWWLVPALVGVVALAVFLTAGPLVLREGAQRVPLLGWQVLAGLVALSLASDWLIGIGEDRCEAKQAVLEDKADVKAASVAKESNAEADKARDSIRKESSDAQAEVRTIVRTLPATCPEQPPRMRELGDAAVEAASREVLPAPER